VLQPSQCISLDEQKLNAHIASAPPPPPHDGLLYIRRYILAYKPDDYVFIYYRGQNDAWVGYGGATVYTR
jgi:hypothetical protein